MVDIQSAITRAGQGPAWHGFDCATNEDKALEYNGPLLRALGDQPEVQAVTGRKPLVASIQVGSRFTGQLDGAEVNVSVAHSGSDAEKTLAYFACRLFGYGLAQGWLTGHPTEEVEGGLEGIGSALRRLKDGEVHGKKLAVKVAEL